MTSYIDDALFAFPQGVTANHQAITILKVMSALGFFLSTRKCQFLPPLRGKFLGLTVNVVETKFEIPQEKLEYILGVIRGALRAPSITQRQLAVIAGLLISGRPAIYMAPLYTRTLFQAMISSNDGEMGE